MKESRTPTEHALEIQDKYQKKAILQAELEKFPPGTARHDTIKGEIIRLETEIAMLDSGIDTKIAA